MTIQVNIHEAKTRLSQLIQRAEAGEEVIIARAGKPAVRLEPTEQTVAKKPFKLGFGKGKWKAPDDIKTPFKDDIEEMFGLKD
jgi:prevent-host-death family protein